MELSSNSTVVASKDVVSCDLGGDEIAMLNIKDGVYYGLDSVGARIWNLIQEPNSLGNILKMLLREYDVEKERCQDDLMKLIQEFIAQGLVEIKNE